MGTRGKKKDMIGTKDVLEPGGEGCCDQTSNGPPENTLLEKGKTKHDDNICLDSEL
jgi:hypothetical protein